MVVDWGDSTQSTITAFNDPAVLHTYPAPGTYVIKITGTLQGFSVNFGGDRLKLLQVLSFGRKFRFGNNGSYFHGCVNLTFAPGVDVPNLTGTTNLSRTFQDCKFFNSPTISSWDVSAVTNTSNMFLNCETLNQPLNSWDVSSITNMEGMLRQCFLFNQPLDAWDVSSVTNMSFMLRAALVFNQPLDMWDVSNVTNMSNLFRQCTVFNQPLNSWNTSNVTNMGAMFIFATNFNQPLNNWDVSKVTSMGNMLQSTSFKQDLSAWSPFACTNMVDMFDAVDMNNPNSATNQTNYNALLTSWGGTKLANMQPNVTFDGGLSKYTAGVAGAARAALLAKGWIIADGGAA